MVQKWINKRGGAGQGEILGQVTQSDKVYVGGLDLAERVDHSALSVWLWDGVNLKQYGYIVWPRIDYKEIFSEIEELNEIISFRIIGYDATGNVGVGSFFPQRLPMEPIKLTQGQKIDCLNSFKYMIQQGIVLIKKGSELEEQILEQEEIVTDAGNIKYSHPPGRHDDLFWSAVIGACKAIPYMIEDAPVGIEYAEAVSQNNLDDDPSIEDVMEWAKWRGVLW